MTPYQKLLTHPKWQKKRLHRLEMAGWRCEECGDAETELHVHHVFYESGRKPWEYDDLELLVLCKACHPLIQQLSSRLLHLAALTGGAVGRISLGYRDGIKYLGAI